MVILSVENGCKGLVIIYTGQYNNKVLPESGIRSPLIDRNKNCWWCIFPESSQPAKNRIATIIGA